MNLCLDFKILASGKQSSTSIIVCNIDKSITENTQRELSEVQYDLKQNEVEVKYKIFIQTFLWTASRTWKKRVICHDNSNIKQHKTKQVTVLADKEE